MTIRFSESLFRLGAVSITITTSSLAQACGYTGGVGMEGLFSTNTLIDVGILFFAGTALVLGGSEILRRCQQNRSNIAPINK